MANRAAHHRMRKNGAPMPEAPAPMLATLVDEPFDNPRWVFEPKYDGLRVLGIHDGRRLTLLSRNHASQNGPFPDIVAALRDAIDRPVIVDGEVVCLDEQGRSSFRALQQRFHLKNDAEIARRARQYPAYLYLFDLLYLDGEDVRARALRERKELLRTAVRWSDRVRWTEFTAETGTDLLRQACREGSEGIIGKHFDSPYAGGRGPWWVKVKCSQRQEFVIGGFTDPQRSRVGLGALLVGYYGDDGKRLIYAGKVGTGYTRETLLDLRERLGRLEQDESPFAEGSPRDERGVHWVRPRLVAEVTFAEWTQHGILRQPRYEGLRTDKKPAECRRERPGSPAAVEARAAGASPGQRSGEERSWASPSTRESATSRKRPSRRRGRAGDTASRPS